MNYIKNIELISEKISDFKESDFKYILSINYFIDYNELYDEISFLEIGFILVSKDGNRYKTLMRFSEVTSLDIKGIGGSYNQIMGFEITSMKDYQWEEGKKYLVNDYEDDVIKFYCKSIEVLEVNRF